MTAEQIQAAANRTRAAREHLLRHRPLESMIGTLAQAARNWLKPDSVWRKRAVEQAPATTGFSKEMVSEAIDLTFGPITEKSLQELFIQLQGSAGRGREAAPTRNDNPPTFIAHFLAGNVPPPGIASICLGLLLKSANLVKVSSRDPVFPALFVESLREVDPELADCVAILNWRREEVALTKAALAESDTVIAFGDDQTIASLREMVRPDARFFGYGHKLSFAVIAKDALTKENVPQLAEAAAFDASIYDQQGCLSPHAFYVEEGGEISPREFAAALAGEMAAYQARVPRGKLSVEETAHIAKLRWLYEFWSAADASVAVWAGGDDITHFKEGGVGLCACPSEIPQAGTPVPPQTSGTTASPWLLIYEEDPMFTPSCLNRVVFVKPIKNLESIPKIMQRLASNLSTVGLAPLDKRAMALSELLFQIGVNRVCAIGEMQRPPLSWQLSDMECGSSTPP